MDFGLIDKKAIIPASSRGLGKACAWSLAKEGVKIFLNGVNEKSLEQTVKEFTQAGFIVDYVLGKIEDEDTRKGLLEKCTDPDILIDNSGGPPPGNFMTGPSLISLMLLNQIFYLLHYLCRM